MARVRVGSYKRSDGTKVRAYTRRAPAAGLAIVVTGFVTLGILGGPAGLQTGVQAGLQAGVRGQVVRAKAGGPSGRVSVKVKVSARKLKIKLPRNQRTSVVIVQLASFPDRSSAERGAHEARADGYPAGVLDSDRFSPMNRGYWVVIVGPFPDNRAGHEIADTIERQRDDDSFAREIRPRPLTER